MSTIGSNWVQNPNRVLKDIEQEFDETASEYEPKSLEWDYRGADDGAAFIARHVTPNARVVEAGCGSGLVGQRLQRAGFDNLTGCDISSAMLELAGAKQAYRQLVKTDIHSIPLADTSFDALICIAVLTYSPDLERAFTEFERLVAPGGTIVFSHRVDLENSCGFSDALSKRLREGRWSTLEVTDARLYYPKKNDYADRVLVKYHAYRRQ